MNTNPYWAAFASVIPADNFQREAVTADFRNGIMLYAKAMAQKWGMAPAKAIDYAAKQVIDSEMHPASVNGMRIMLSRDIGGTHKLTDADIAREANNLKLALTALDPHQVKLTDEYGRPIFDLPKGTESARMDVLRDKIRMHGFPALSADGKTVSYYVRNGLQTPVELRDQNGAAFLIERAKLPDLRGPVYYGPMLTKVRGPAPDLGVPTVTEVMREAKMQMEWFGGALKGAEYSTMVGTGQFTTNWPVNPDWLKRRTTDMPPKKELPSYKTKKWSEDTDE